MSLARPAFALVCVVALIAFAFMLPLLWLGIIIVFVACPLNWIVAGLLWRLARKAPDEPALIDRAVAATSVAIAVTLFAFIMLNSDFLLNILAAEQARLLSRVGTLILAFAPALWWLKLYLDPEEK